MVQKWKVTFPAPGGPDERNAYLYLPASYDGDPARRYPVLYMFDGHNVFFDADATYGKCWGMQEYLDAAGAQMIVAALECNHSPDYGRLKEYAPFSFRDPKLGNIEGLGQVTAEWLIHTFKADIDRRFRTLPGRKHTYVAGSSMGGLMSLYLLLSYNRVFSRAAALSPSIWTAPAKLDALIRNCEIEPDTVLYLDYGSNEIRFHANMWDRFEKVTGLLLRKRVLLTSRIVPGGDHCEACWEKQIPFFMEVLQQDGYR